MQTYLRDPAGNPVYSGTVNIDGRSYVLTPADFTPSSAALEHLTHSVTLKSNTRGTWDWQATASVYRYERDEIRTPTVALPGASDGGTGRIGDQSGTGWSTLAVKGIWRPGGGHEAEFGLQRDAFKLRSTVWNTTEWRSGGRSSRQSGFTGDSTLTSLWAQDTWRFAPRWRSVLGVRAERWHAFNGSIAGGAAAGADRDVNRSFFGERHETHFSPKLAIAFNATETLTLKASAGRAVRMPTLSELYQGSLQSNVIVNNDPNLKPEKSWTAELSAELAVGDSLMRATLFGERTRDALYSQTNVTVTPNVTNVQNVDAIRSVGVELAAQTVDVAIKGFDVQASATWIDSKITRNDKFPASVGQRQPRVPAWRASLLASYAWADGWSASLGARYSGRQYGTLDNVDPNGSAYTGFSPFFVADLRLQYKSRAGWTASLGVDNVGNREYWAFHPYPQRTWHGELRWDL